MMIAVIVVYCVLNVVIQTVIQPKFVGDAVGLSTTLTFVSLVFWTWVIGPLGALLAIPLTLLAKALLIDIDPTAQWLRPLISNKDTRRRTAGRPARRPRLRRPGSVRDRDDLDHARCPGSSGG